MPAVKPEADRSMRKLFAQQLKDSRAELRRLCRNIHSHPEPGYEEVRAAGWQTALLRSWGFRVAMPVAGLATAFKASWGAKGPTFCFVSEYDALPLTDHGCGHNLIATGALAAGLLTRAALQKLGLPGRVVVMGTPGEEGKGGKVDMVAKGAFRGVDACMMAHPFYRTLMDPGCLSVHRYEVDYYGYSSHAAVNPEQGKNALDAVTLLFQGVNAWRQHLPEDSRVHGIITEGGAAPNIIPNFAGCLFYLRSASETVHDVMVRRFRNIVRGAALMTDTKFKIAKLENAYLSGIPNQCMNEEFYRLAAERGLAPNRPRRGGRVSTDFGNVSHVVPGIHVYYAITDKALPLHSLEFAAAAGTGHAFSRALTVSEIMAAIACRFYADAAFRAQIKKEFRQAVRADSPQAG